MMATVTVATVRLRSAEDLREPGLSQLVKRICQYIAVAAGVERVGAVLLQAFAQRMVERLWQARFQRFVLEVIHLDGFAGCQLRIHGAEPVTGATAQCRGERRSQDEPERMHVISARSGSRFVS